MEILNKVSTIYKEFFKILFVLILAFAVIGYVNDYIISLFTPLTINEQMEGSILFKNLYMLQFIGFFGLVFVFYRNKVQFFGWFRNANAKKFSKKITSTLLTTSIVSVLLPYFFLILS